MALTAGALGRGHRAFLPLGSPVFVDSTVPDGRVWQHLVLAHDLGSARVPDDDVSAQLYDATGEACAGFGLAACEISNYARAGAESRHNLAYWRYGDYAGVGPGAHGRVTVGGTLRATRRHRAPEPWAERVERDGHGSTAEEIVAPRDRAREALLMGLRLAEGVDLGWFAERTGMVLCDAVDEGIFRACVEEGYLVVGEGKLRATSEGRRRLDALLPRLLL